MNESKYVQYGCGWSAPSQWRNFDASPTLRFERMQGESISKAIDNWPIL
ncbi:MULTISPECIES: hypothetical protein [Microcystis]|nr:MULTISPECIES: hypothetical protein [Microcystis]MCA2819451.1 hypothetical protein [Microcystis sp. M085S1]MCA2855504.1 hypothetical protein [Microcystis sp. M065S1]MBE8995243.1 hypothetical protein [Microcystis aeruginosa LEGE 91341]MCA2627908.1 hypothetical protein [Microcystis sp. M091S2]MCA2648189.1 hypothetical protein [Microcystis sp. M069S2]